MNYEYEFDHETTATKRAVGAAAEEDEDDDNIGSSCQEYGGVSLQDGEPDITIHIDCDESTDTYRYTMLDPGSELAHKAQGKVIGAEDSSPFLFTVRASLKSVMRHSINARLCARYGFATRTDAIESGKKLTVLIGLNDLRLVKLGHIITEAAGANCMPFWPIKRAQWDLIARRLRGFDLQWELISDEAPTLVSLRKWSESLPMERPPLRSAMPSPVAA